MSAPPDDSPAARALRRRVFSLVFVTVFLDLIGFGIVIPQLPFIIREMHGTADLTGLALAAFSVAQLFSNPILGRISDRVGRRPVILASLVGNAIALGLFALSIPLSSLPLLFLARLVGGATAGNLTACQAAVSDVARGEDRARGLGILGAGAGLGLVLGPVLGTVARPLGAWFPALAASVLAVADLLAAVWLMPETRTVERSAMPAKATDGTSLRSLLSDRRTASVLALFVLTYVALTQLQVAFGLLASARVQWGEREVAYAFVLFGIVLVVVQGALIGPLTRRFAHAALLTAGSAGMLVGMLVFALSWTTLGLGLAVAIVAASVGVLSPVLADVAALYAGAGREGALLGWTQSAGGIGLVLGPVLGGFLFTHVGANAPFVAGTLAGGTCVALSVGLFPRRGPPAAVRAARPTGPGAPDDA